MLRTPASDGVGEGLRIPPPKEACETPGSHADAGDPEKHSGKRDEAGDRLSQEPPVLSGVGVTQSAAVTPSARLILESDPLQHPTRATVQPQRFLELRLAT